MSPSEKKLLKEYIKLINEYGDALGDLSMTDKNDFAKIFISPFSDVASTAKKAISNFGVKARTLLSVAVEGAISIIIPGVSEDYSDIYKKEKRDLEILQQKYYNVNKNTKEILRSEASFIAFMLSPVSFISSVLVYKAPQKALKIVDVLAGNNRYIQKKYNNITNFISNLKRASSKYEKMFKVENKIIKEQDEIPESIVNEIISFITDPQTIQILERSPTVQNMKKDTERVIDNTIRYLKQKVDIVANINSFEELEKAVGKRLLQQNDPEITPEEINSIKIMMTQEIKESILETYLKLTNANLSEIIKAGVEEDADLVKKYVQFISYLKSKLK